MNLLELTNLFTRKKNINLYAYTNTCIDCHYDKLAGVWYFYDENDSRIELDNARVEQLQVTSIDTAYSTRDQVTEIMIDCDDNYSGEKETKKMTDFEKAKRNIEAQFYNKEIKYCGLKHLTANIVSIIVMPYDSMPYEFLFDRITGKEIK